jgi:hypothetical protein
MPNLNQRIFQRLEKILPPILIVAYIVLMIAIWISLQRTVSVSFATHRQLKTVAAATKNFYDDFNRWPTDLTELNRTRLKKPRFVVL